MYRSYQVKSWMERKVMNVLEKRKLRFWYEPCSFYLRPHRLTYTPDFLLCDLMIHDKQVILEPHGDRFSFRTFILFREVYGNLYHLIMIVRNNAIPNIPKESYDDIWPIEYVYLLPKHLQKIGYTPQKNN